MLSDWRNMGRGRDAREWEVNLRKERELGKLTSHIQALPTTFWLTPEPYMPRADWKQLEQIWIEQSLQLEISQANDWLEQKHQLSLFLYNWIQNFHR